MFPHLFCIKLDLFSDFIFQIFDILRWHIEHFINKHSNDTLPCWKIEVLYYNQKHQFQFQSMLMFYQNLLSSQRQYQQENVFLEICQQSNLINNFPFHLKDFHPFFINSFEKYLENFSSWKIVNSLTFTHNTNNFFLAFESKSSYLQSGLLSLSLNISQSLIEIHPDFYDPIGIQLERKFQEKDIFIKLLTIIVHFTYRFNFLSSIRFVFLFLTFELYIHAGIKVIKWLHWKYDYT